MYVLHDLSVRGQHGWRGGGDSCGAHDLGDGHSAHDLSVQEQCSCLACIQLCNFMVAVQWVQLPHSPEHTGDLLMVPRGRFTPFKVVCSSPPGPGPVCSGCSCLVVVAALLFMAHAGHL